jgi:hypothetical protein
MYYHEVNTLCNLHLLALNFLDLKIFYFKYQIYFLVLFNEMVTLFSRNFLSSRLGSFAPRQAGLDRISQISTCDLELDSRI